MPQTTPITSHYRSALLPVYGRVCGETKSLETLEDSFRRYLEWQAANVRRSGFQLANAAVAYGSILDLSADVRLVQNIFNVFLSGGERCPENSLARRAMSFGNSLSQIRDADVLNQWHVFLPDYLGLLQILSALAVEHDGLDPLEYSTALWFAALRVHLVGELVREGVNRRINGGAAKNARLSLLGRQSDRIKEFQESVVLVRDLAKQAAAAGRESQKMAEFLDGLYPFRQAIARLYDPFVWMQTVVIPFVEDFVSRLPIIMSNDPTMLWRTSNPAAMWRLFDNLLLHYVDDPSVAASPLNVALDGESLVISAPVRGSFWRALNESPDSLRARLELTFPKDAGGVSEVQIVIPLTDASGLASPHSSGEGGSQADPDGRIRDMAPAEGEGGGTATYQNISGFVSSQTLSPAAMNDVIAGNQFFAGYGYGLGLAPAVAMGGIGVYPTVLVLVQ